MQKPYLHYQGSGKEYHEDYPNRKLAHLDSAS